MALPARQVMGEVDGPEGRARTVYTQAWPDGTVGKANCNHCKETALELIIPRESFLEEDLDMVWKEREKEC